MPINQSMSDAAEPAWIGEVLRFWFGELGESDWFKKSDAFDAMIRERFLALHGQLVAQGGDGLATPRAMLALVIVLDQFSRNIFRGQPRAFAADPIARQVARAAIAQGFDAAMSAHERLFFYLPFEHSEERADQAFAVELMTRLGNADWTRYALAHKEIIDRFGRFPHRNAILDRPSTADELELLKDPTKSF